MIQAVFSCWLIIDDSKSDDKRNQCEKNSASIDYQTMNEKSPQSDQNISNNTVDQRSNDGYVVRLGIEKFHFILLKRKDGNF